ncbi:MAG: hypothetical protein WC346_02205 [Methanogenium sp.]
MQKICIIALLICIISTLGCSDTMVDVTNETANVTTPNATNTTTDAATKIDDGAEDKTNESASTINIPDTETVVDDICFGEELPIYENCPIVVGNIDKLGNGRTYVSSYWLIGNCTNNNSAVDPTYKQAFAFITADKTDEIALDDTQLINDTIKMHNSAEEQGLRTGIIVAQTDQNRIAMGIVFNTTDKGSVCFSCVYEDQDFHPTTHDVTMSAKVGSCMKFVDISEHKTIKTTFSKKGWEVT